MTVDGILQDLQCMMDSNQELEILNFYQSFPITSKASIRTLDRGTATLYVQPPGSVCLATEDQTIILSKDLPEAVRARVISFNILNGMLFVDDFSYAGSHFGERMIARVQPDEEIAVEIEIEGQRYSGKLADVSLNGIGVYTTSDVSLRGLDASLTLPFPEGLVTLPGKILNTNQTPEGQTRLSIGFTRKAQEIDIVTHYIKERRIEILTEIEQMYERTYQDKQSSSTRE
jgi:hypothetical protein